MQSRIGSNVQLSSQEGIMGGQQRVHNWPIHRRGTVATIHRRLRAAIGWECFWPIRHARSGEMCMSSFNCTNVYWSTKISRLREAIYIGQPIHHTGSSSAIRIGCNIMLNIMYNSFSTSCRVVWSAKRDMRSCWCVHRMATVICVY